MSYLATYLKTIAERGNIDLAHSIEHTATEIGDKYIQDFNFCEHRIGLLFGNVQSGKTGHPAGWVSSMLSSARPPTPLTRKPSWASSQADILPSLKQWKAQRMMPAWERRT